MSYREVLEAKARKLVEIASEVESYLQDQNPEMARERIVKGWMVLSQIDRILSDWHQAISEWERER